MKLRNNKCPKCGGNVLYEDQSVIGGDSNYWICPYCDEEQIMFITRKKRRGND